MNIWDKFLDAVKVNEEYDDDDFLDDVDDDFEDEKPKKRFFKKLDDDYDDEFDDLPPAKNYKSAEKQSAAAKAPKASRTTTSSSTASKSSASKVTPMYNVNKKKSGASGEVCVMKPKRFDEATEIVDALLDNCTVILNLEGLDMELAQHIIDFTSGASYSLDGSIRRVSAYIFILTPEGVDITGDSQDFLNDVVGSIY
ncbi:MAG: cell division protein SepF [Blautia sp.]|uniref:cell division protein SepF n=1 Tax=Blautia sp. TaxID=1955243 RepID=UPI002E781AD6|nr:cell division protein SepF [Blautia sp.]MEE1443223.1 cell division protein SepF [Blautia sp.]